MSQNPEGESGQNFEDSAGNTQVESIHLSRDLRNRSKIQAPLRFRDPDSDQSKKSQTNPDSASSPLTPTARRKQQRQPSMSGTPEDTQSASVKLQTSVLASAANASKVLRSNCKKAAAVQSVNQNTTDQKLNAQFVQAPTDAEFEADAESASLFGGNKAVERPAKSNNEIETTIKRIKPDPEHIAVPQIHRALQQTLARKPVNDFLSRAHGPSYERYKKFLAEALAENPWAPLSVGVRVGNIRLQGCTSGTRAVENFASRPLDMAASDEEDEDA